MTTLKVLLHVAAERDYELHSLDFSTTFLQGSLHKEIWLRRPPGFTKSFPAGTQWSPRWPVYGLRQAPSEWHDTLRTTLAALGFAPATADPLLFLRTNTSLPPFYILVYVDDLVYATADTEALTLLKSELQKRHTCTDLGELRNYLGLQITRDRARRTITLTQSHMVHQVLQRFGFQFSLPQPTPLSTSHSLSAPPLDESVEPSGPYPELVGCLMYLMTRTQPDLAYPLSLLARYVAPGRHRKGYTFSLGSGSGSWRSTRSSSVLSSSFLYVDNKAMIALCQEHRLEHRTKHIALRYFLARELRQRGQLRLAYVATRASTAYIFTKALPPGDHQPCFAFLDWSCDHLFSPTLPMGDLVTHLCTSDASYSAALPAEFLNKNPPPMYMSLYFIVTRLPDSLRAVRDHFLALEPTNLTVDLLEQHLLATETSVVTVGASRGTPRTPFFEGCSPSPLAPSYASFFAVEILGAGMSGLLLLLVGSVRIPTTRPLGQKGFLSSGAAAARARVAGVVALAAGVVVGAAVEVVAAVGVVVGVGALVAAVVAAVGVAVVTAVGVVAVGVELFRRERAVSGGSVSCPYVIRTGDRAGQTCEKPHTQHRCFSRLDDAWRTEFGDEAERPRSAELLIAEGDCNLCVPPDPGIDIAALGASESALPGTAPAEALHTFTLDSSASRCFFRDSTTLTPLPAPVPIRLADPSGGPVLARSSTFLSCPAVPSDSQSGLHLPSFSTNLVSASGLVAPPCSCRLLSHQILLWHHRLGHPSLPCLHGMHSRLLVSGLPRSLPPLPPSPAPPCLPCIEGRQRAAPHSSFPPTTAPLQTLHMDM
ncbi:unnamed protein product [Closterium sp. NIES-53]